MKKTYLLIFAIIVSVVMLFSFYTDNRWEDWYITYRASKNLATGNGLVFNAGEHVHSFTSPLGTLIPAFINVATGNISDDLVIWIFRIFNACLLGLTGIMLFKITEHLKVSVSVSWFLICLLGTHILVVAFSMNGMEAALMIFFITWFLTLLIIPQDLFNIKMAFALAGLMYSRPDAFVYAGSIGLGFLFFYPQVHGQISTRVNFLKMFLPPVCIAAALYLPWIIWTWSYYGSPVPHTVTAKGVGHNYSLQTIIFDILKWPFQCLYQSNTLSVLFMPPYPGMGGWFKIHYISKLICLPVVYGFLFMRINNLARAVSFATFLMHFYLCKISGQAGQPWYLAIVVLPSIFVLALLFDELLKSHFFSTRRKIVYAAMGSVLLFEIFIFSAGAYELKTQQRICNSGNRKQIGLWLREHAGSPKETVFMECLGYIGFYSGLKTYDCPGMSSPEVVACRKRIKSDTYAAIINDLRPDWLALRTVEVEDVNRDMPDLLPDNYDEMKKFDVTDSIPEMLGRNYLLCDASFSVFKLKKKE